MHSCCLIPRDSPAVARHCRGLRELRGSQGWHALLQYTFSDLVRPTMALLPCPRVDVVVTERSRDGQGLRRFQWQPAGCLPALRCRLWLPSRRRLHIQRLRRCDSSDANGCVRKAGHVAVQAARVHEDRSAIQDRDTVLRQGQKYVNASGPTPRASLFLDKGHVFCSEGATHCGSWACDGPSSTGWDAHGLSGCCV